MKNINCKASYPVKLKFLRNNRIDCEIRKVFVKSCLQNLILYKILLDSGIKIETLISVINREKRCLDGAEMWIWRKMTNTSRANRKFNVEVLRHVKEERKDLKLFEKTNFYRLVAHNNLF